MMMEIMTPAVMTIPDSIGKYPEKSCQSIHPVQDIFPRKVKILKSQSLNWENSWSFVVK
jgi:small subunit ribosomal protein S3Ae